MGPGAQPRAQSEGSSAGGTPLPSSGTPCFSCPEDLLAVAVKLRPLWDAGVRTYFIAFDVVPELIDPRDIAAYGVGEAGYARASADFLNRLLVALRQQDPRAHLMTIGARYHGTSDLPYLQALRATLHPAIEVLWTGPAQDCCGSTPYGPDAVAAISGLIGRRPVMWENWINNDRTGGFEQQIYLGPYRRDPAVASMVNGFLFNAMSQPDLNSLPLGTASDWLRGPSRYAPRRAFLRHVDRLAGDLSPWLRAFAETSAASRLDPRGAAPTFAPRRGCLVRIAPAETGRAAATSSSASSSW